VNRRATSWLLAALMAFCAAHAVPPATQQRAGANPAIVWTAAARKRAEQPAAIRKLVRYSRTRVVTPLPESLRAVSSVFSQPLFQRPPPLLLS